MGTKLFIRIPIHLHSSDAMENMKLHYVPNGFIFCQDFVIKATPINKLTYMRKCPRGARKV